ncbi:MAG TPA: family 16 glycoside hydrolase, partial [Roseiflexaceae bacterium]|nr:family 16 glycoside hydrolase [Roseiflexaceae bacterium]
MKTVYRVAMLVAFGLALLPALASAQPPAPKGRLVFEDDFSSATKSGLEDNVNATDYSRGFHPPGVYHLKLSNPNEVRFALLPNQSYGQFSAQLDIWDNSDAFTGSVSQGLVFRARDATHMYAVLIEPRKGQYAVRKLDGRQWTDLVAFEDSPLIKRQAEVNQLRVDAEGDDFTVYLNGETLVTFSDASYDKGGIGLITANVDAEEPHMHFDNLKIYSTEAAPAGAPAGLPRSGGSDGPALALAALALL